MNFFCHIFVQNGGYKPQKKGFFSNSQKTSLKFSFRIYIYKSGTNTVVIVV